MDGEVRQMNENIYINLGTIAPRGTDKATLNKYVCGKERERERDRDNYVFVCRYVVYF